MGQIMSEDTSIGGVTWHSSEDDGGPDVGISIYLGEHDRLWAGEITRKAFEENNGSANFDSDGGWFLLRYQGNDTKLIAKFGDGEEAREFIEQVAIWIRSAPAPAGADVREAFRNADQQDWEHLEMIAAGAKAMVQLCQKHQADGKSLPSRIEEARVCIEAALTSTPAPAGSDVREALQEALSGLKYIAPAIPVLRTMLMTKDLVLGAATAEEMDVNNKAAIEKLETVIAALAFPSAMPPNIKSFSASTVDGRCLEVWFKHNVTDADRAWLLAAINEKYSAPSVPGVERIAQIIGGNIFGSPDDQVGPATKAARQEALQKARAILALIEQPARDDGNAK
jgi:hypothetical protein